jgi:hypothetical protein
MFYAVATAALLGGLAWLLRALIAWQRRPR